MSFYYDSNLWTLTKDEKSDLILRVKAYIAENPALSINIKEALDKNKVIRGMNKDEVLLLLGPPERKILKAQGEEVWWYDIRETHCLFYLFPLGWPWVLLHPQDIFDCKQRDELYWDKSVLKDLKSYRVEVL